ncbi:MAG: sugar ABC transporter permease [Caulobacterales bacterium]|nr:sugar ABC transporter permease [Caulobacterales bacterium]
MSRGGAARRSEAISAYAFLLAPLAILTVSTFGPILFSFALAFFDWNLLSPDRPFIGLDNFIELAGDDVFHIALANTAIYAAGVVPIQTALALGLAMAVNQNIPARAFFRAAFYIPAITSSVVTSVMFLWIYSKTGLLNYALSMIGVTGPDWIGSPRYALGSIMALNIWSTSGYFMIAFLAGLQTIPPTLYEAAKMDGAGPWSRFWNVTIPSLRPTIYFVATLGLIGCFQVFDQIYIMSNGGPANATTTMSFFIYNSAFSHFRFGYASAAAIILFVIILLLTLLQRRVLQPETPE